MICSSVEIISLEILLQSTFSMKNNYCFSNDVGIAQSIMILQVRMRQVKLLQNQYQMLEIRKTIVQFRGV